KASEDNGNKKTPLDYIKELGVTEVHILPMFDFATVKETFNEAEFDGENQYNWGYDPLNYNVPEGSYSSDPANGAVRVKELKQMVMALHEAGIRVIMDVVYNHVSNAGNSNFEALLPDYFFRTDNTGKRTNGSGCGNDTASERYMFRKFMVESVNYWADEYKLDGFRFDLMGLHDTVTMNEIYDTLYEKNHDIMVYGEGWKMGTMVETKEMKAANMYNAALMPNIAFFNDVTRDALKGGGFGAPMSMRGYSEGSKNDPAVYIGAVGATANSDAGYRVIGKSSFATNPTQNINYVSCHDNTTLWDKINACSLSDDVATMKAMNRIAATAVLTSQGPTFFLAGEEMLRSKPVDKDKHGLT
ncbi:MAG: type I pullulanase, partial [Clostridiales bacterium]|nr:type I pullulanase [Clostridiales bacterium]